MEKLFSHNNLLIPQYKFILSRALPVIEYMLFLLYNQRRIIKLRTSNQMISQDTFITLLYEILIAAFLGTVFTIITQGLSHHTKKWLLFLNFFFTSILVISLCYVRFNNIFNDFFINFNTHWQEYKVFIANAITSLTTEQLKDNNWVFITVVPSYLAFQIIFSCISISKIVNFNEQIKLSCNIFYIVKIVCGFLLVCFIFSCFYTIIMFITFKSPTYEEDIYIKISLILSLILNLLASVVIREYNKFINGY